MLAATRFRDSKAVKTPEPAKPVVGKEQPVTTVENDSQHAPITRDSVSRNWHNLDNRFAMIAEAAYFKAETRGYATGHDVVDWFEAEQERAQVMGEA